MQRFRPGYQLELANFFGDRVADTDVIHTTTVGNAKYGEEHHLSFRQFNVEGQRFPYPDEHLDGVLFCEILEHLTHDPVAALLECHRVLKPGGWLLLTTPNFARYENLYRLWRGENPGDQYSGYGPYGRHNREYTLPEVERLLIGAGFQIERLQARSLGHPVEASWLYKLTRRFRPAGSQEEHLFCLAHRTADSANHERPAWLYRSLPQE
jgi:SAM-dependent methyltransferase